MKTRNILLLLPSIIYGWLVGLRNYLYDRGWKKSHTPTIPTICVGNLSVGGTGKTPHIEMLIRLLKSEYKIAILSRGYGRKGDAPLRAQRHHTAEDIGDEPAQILNKFPNIDLWIDGNRKRALRSIENLPEEERPDVILMDDGFQHRQVSPTYSIILTPYHHPFTRDHLLPYGNLRESIAGKERADTIIVTSTPRDLRPIDFRLLEGELSLFAYQDLYFSRIVYGRPIPIFGTSGENTMELLPHQHVLAVCGIANPERFLSFLRDTFSVSKEILYSDHHLYTAREVNFLIELLMDDKSLYLITTEKDAIRFKPYRDKIPKGVLERLFVLPIRIEMSPESTKRLLTKVHKAIQNNSLKL